MQATRSSGTLPSVFGVVFVTLPSPLSSNVSLSVPSIAGSFLRAASRHFLRMAAARDLNLRSAPSTLPLVALTESTCRWTAPAGPADALSAGAALAEAAADAVAACADVSTLAEAGVGAAVDAAGVAAPESFLSQPLPSRRPVSPNARTRSVLFRMGPGRYPKPAPGQMGRRRGLVNGERATGNETREGLVW